MIPATCRNKFGIALFYDHASVVIGTVADHVNSFPRFSKHYIVPMDLRGAAAADIELDKFDALVFHYSVVISSEAYLRKSFAKKVAKFSGTKILLIQDEYRWVNRTTQACMDLGISVIFSVVNPSVLRKIYRDPWFDAVRFETTLTGFVPARLCSLETPVFETRPFDVAYRGRKLSAAFGSFAQEKWLIGERFRKDAQNYALKCNISSNEADRIYGDSWIDFLKSAKAVLGTESGSGICDFDGSLIEIVEEFERKNPRASFQDIKNRFFSDRDGEISVQVISPRCFEAAALRTLMILYPGKYSGVLEPWRHYVPLKRDHSNMDDVVDVIRSPERAKAIIDRAYREVACSGRWSHEAFIDHFDRVLNEEVTPRHPLCIGPADMKRPIRRINFIAGVNIWKMRLILLGHRFAIAFYQFLSTNVPEPFSSFFIGIGRRIYRKIRLVARRVML
jgi:hypothetical protein